MSTAPIGCLTTGVVCNVECGLCNQSYYAEFVRNLTATSVEYIVIVYLKNKIVEREKIVQKVIDILTVSKKLDVAEPPDLLELVSSLRTLLNIKHYLKTWNQDEQRRKRYLPRYNE